MKKDIEDFKQGFVLVLEMCGFLLVTGIVIVITVCLGFKAVSFILRLFGL